MNILLNKFLIEFYINLSNQKDSGKIKMTEMTVQESEDKLDSKKKKEKAPVIISSIV